MFGIGLPEMILILALALIVVGPDKLPDLARSLAKGILELKKTAETLKKNLTEEGNPLDVIKPELDDATRTVRNSLVAPVEQEWITRTPGTGVNPDADTAPIIDAEVTAIDEPANSPPTPSAAETAGEPAPHTPDATPPAT